MSRTLTAGVAVSAAAVTFVLAGCSGFGFTPRATVVPATTMGSQTMGSQGMAAPEVTTTGQNSAAAIDPGPLGASLPGMPPLLDPNDVWAADRPGQLSPAVAGIVPRVYVPNSVSNTVTVINPATFRVLKTVRVGREPQHVVPSWDLKTLWVNSDLGNSLTPINPRTGKFGRPVAVRDPYNLYFTPNGQYAIVMAERMKRIDFRDPHTMALHDSTTVRCSGVNHADFTTDGRFFLVSCEFSGQLLWLDTTTHKVLKTLRLPGKKMSMPQDVKLSADGQTFYVADMARNGVWMVNAHTATIVGFVHTGLGAHGLYITRDSKSMLVSNRGEGSISVIDLATHKVRVTWRLPGGGSPDMGGISADGHTFWVSGRYNSVIYAISTKNGHLIRKIKVGAGPHGLCIFPQPGRYSLGHTGVFR
jgi:YVTN family beta-propeller protein